MAGQRAKLEAEAAREAALSTCVRLRCAAAVRGAHALTAMPYPRRARPTETHAVAARKEAEMDGLRAAFGLKQAPNEGDAFDRELQERKRLERQAERENVAKERERAKRVRGSV